MTPTDAPDPTTPVRGAATARAGGDGLVRWLAAFALGATAPGVPFVMVTIELERSGAAPVWFAGVAVARLAPCVVVSPVAGALAARVAPRLLFVTSAVARAAIAIALGVSLVVDAPAAVPVVLLFVLVAAGCATYPALMRLVEAHAGNRVRGASVAAGVESAAFWAGPALGGVLLVVGPVGATATCAAMWLTSAALACSMPAVEVSIATDPMATVASRSVRCLFGRAIRPAIVSVLVLNAVAGFVTTLLVRLPTELGIGGMPEYARLSIALGWGAVLTTFVVVAPTQVGAGALISLACGGAAVVALGTVPSLLAATLACAVLGGSVMASEMAAATRITTRIAAPFVAPAVGVLEAAMVAAMVVGAIVAPLAIETIGTRAGVVSAGVAALVAAAVTSPILTHRSAATVRGNEPPVGAVS